MSTEPLSPPLVDFWGVLSGSKRIINAHSRHFLALSVLFLLPLSFSLTVFPTLLQILSPSNQTPVLRLQSQSPHEYVAASSSSLTIQITAVYALLATFLSLCACASISFSVFQGFYGRPVKLLSALKSLSKSFLPLFVTVVLANLAFLAILFAFVLLAFLVFMGVQLIGFQISYSSPFFVAFCAICSVPLVLLLLYLQVNWALVSAVVVAESTWGIEPLRRSALLVKGMRRVSLSLCVFFGFLISILMWCSSGSALGWNGVGDGWKNWAFFAQIVVISALISVLMLHNLAASAVFYMYCKAMHGELAGEIVAEFAWEYISLPFDDEKVPHVVSIIPT